LETITSTLLSAKGRWLASAHNLHADGLFLSDFYDEYAFLQKEIATRLDAKLEVISSHADVVLDLGAGTGLLSQSRT
jgi:predicted TPR repeat methyltransferase